MKIFPKKTKKKGLGFRKKHINPKHKDKKTLLDVSLSSLLLSFAREREKEKNKSAEEDTENNLKRE